MPTQTGEVASALLQGVVEGEPQGKHVLGQMRFVLLAPQAKVCVHSSAVEVQVSRAIVIESYHTDMDRSHHRLLAVEALAVQMMVVAAAAAAVESIVKELEVLLMAEVAVVRTVSTMAAEAEAQGVHCLALEELEKVMLVVEGLFRMVFETMEVVSVVSCQSVEVVWVFHLCLTPKSQQA